MSKKNTSSIGRTWDDIEKEIFSPEEIAESELRVAIIGAMIEAREEKGVTQKELEIKSGVNQSIISRMETGDADPQLTTILKVLRPLGKKLAVVALEDDIEL